MHVHGVQCFLLASVAEFFVVTQCAGIKYKNGEEKFSALNFSINNKICLLDENIERKNGDFQTLPGL